MCTMRWTDERLMQVGSNGPISRSARLSTAWSHFCCFFSVVGNAKPQHPGDGDDRGAFPPREPRVFIHAQPGTSALHNHNRRLAAADAVSVSFFRDGRNWRDSTRTNSQLL